MWGVVRRHLWLGKNGSTIWIMPSVCMRFGLDEAARWELRDVVERHGDPDGSLVVACRSMGWVRGQVWAGHVAWFEACIGEELGKGVEPMNALRAVTAGQSWGGLLNKWHIWGINAGLAAVRIGASGKNIGCNGGRDDGHGSVTWHRPWAGRAALFGCQQCVGFCVHWGSGGHVLLWT